MYNFDEVVKRENTAAAKWNEVMQQPSYKGLVPLTTADMEFKTCTDIVEAMKQRLDHGIFGYTKPDAHFYNAVSSFVQTHHGFSVASEMLVCTTSVVPAIAAGIKACSKEGDGVIVFSPAYTAFYTSIQNTDRELKDCQLLYENGSYAIDFAKLETLAKDKKNRILILCNPHNPVGRVWHREELERIVAICKQYDLYILSDEIHWDIILKGNHVSLGVFKDSYKERILLFTAPSKTYNLAGAMLAYTIIFDEALRTAFKRELIKTGQGEAVSIFGYETLIAAYEKGGLWLTELLGYIKGNVDLFEMWIAENEPEIHMVRPEGTYLVWLDVRNVRCGFDSWFSHMQQEGIYLTDGAYFGEQGKGFVRVNLALPRKELLKVLAHWKNISLSVIRE